MEKFDVVVVGGGPGGYPAAIRAAQLGASVALVEREALGGTCLNWGCIPTKTLIAGADLYFRARHSKSLGLRPGKMSFDFGAMKERKDGVVETLRGGVGQLLKSNGVTVFEGTASFTGRHTLSVTPRKGKKVAIEAGKTIIATGSAPVVPGFIPKSPRVLDSTAFLDKTTLPKSLIVLGGGVIGCEFACMAAQLGTKVTIVEMLDDVMMVLDSDIRRALCSVMKKELGIKILTGTPLTDIAADADGVTGMVGENTVKAEELLVSIGRRPVTDGLDLENAGIATDERGFIEIDDRCATKIAGIYAIGDVTAGTTQLAHAATAEGITAAENACGQRSLREKLVPACIFTAPEVGCAGLSEQEAKEQGLDVTTGKFMFAGLGKAMAAGETHGFLKWIAEAATGQLLGAHVVGPHATELIAEAATAIRNELTVEELGRTIHCHPTFSEAWMEAAHALHGECIHQPAKRR